MGKLNLLVKRVLYLFIGTLFLFSCQKSALEEYYEQPSGVGASIWESLQEEGRFKLFLEAVEKLGHEKSLQFSLVTVMAPPDDVFNKFLSENGYGSLGDVPEDQLKYIIEFHLIDWPHSSGEFRAKSKKFKRRTRTSLPNYVEVDSEGAETHYISFQKYLMFFTEELFNSYGANAVEDYKLLTGNDFENFHVFGTNITVPDRSFANGWVHEVDQVMIPPANMDKWLEERPEYSTVYNLVNRFEAPQTAGSGVATMYDEDGNRIYTQTNTLIKDVNWTRSFWPTYESTGYGGGVHNPPVVKGGGISFIAYSNSAMEQCMTDNFSLYANRYGDNYMDSIPQQIIRELLSPVTFRDMIFPSKIKSGARLNVEGEEISVNIEANDAEIALCSNGIVYGVNEYQTPRMLKSVTKPLLTDPQYSDFALLVQQVGVINALRDKDISFTIFPPTNEAIRAELIEHAELWQSGNLNTVFSEDGRSMSTPALNDLVSSHIIIGDVEPDENTSYHKCYGGWYVALNNTNVWSGANDSLPSLGSQITSPEVDNGSVYGVDQTIKKNNNTTGFEIYNRPEFSEFKALCNKVSLFDSRTRALKFIVYPYRYTAFIPTNDVLTAMADEIPDDDDELVSFIKYHFVRNDIFSDGVISGTIQTGFLDAENTTDYKEVYHEVEVTNAQANLKVQGKTNTEPVSVVEGTGSNIICADGVVHSLNGVLKY